MSLTLCYSTTYFHFSFNVLSILYVALLEEPGTIQLQTTTMYLKYIQLLKLEFFILNHIIENTIYQCWIVEVRAQNKKTKELQFRDRTCGSFRYEIPDISDIYHL